MHVVWVSRPRPQSMAVFPGASEHRAPDSWAGARRQAGSVQTLPSGSQQRCELDRHETRTRGTRTNTDGPHRRPGPGQQGFLEEVVLDWAPKTE